MIERRRIAYFLDWKFNSTAGVPLKVLDQISTWKSIGLEVDLYVVAPVNFASSWNSNAYNWIFVFSYENFFGRYISRIRALRKIMNNHYEFVYCRFGIMDPFQLYFLKRIRVAIEVNSNWIWEFFQRSKLLYSYIKLTQKYIFKNSFAICTVTSELETKVISITKNSDSVCTVPNSIDIGKVNKLEMECKEIPTLCFIGSPNQAWHGIERILELAELLPNFEFKVIGPKAPQLRHLSPNVHFTGELYGEPLYRLLSEVDVGISSLNLDKHAGSPLKTRWYLALGIPVILGYKDEALDSSSKYIFEIKSEQWPINENIVLAIENFVKNWHNKRINDLKSGEISAQKIEKDRIDFLLKRLSNV